VNKELDLSRMQFAAMTYLGFVAVRWLNVVHNVDVNIVENDVYAAVGSTLLFINHVSEDHSGLGR
jgi:hypothetical protein